MSTCACGALIASGSPRCMLCGREAGPPGRSAEDPVMRDAIRIAVDLAFRPEEPDRIVGTFAKLTTSMGQAAAADIQRQFVATWHAHRSPVNGSHIDTIIADDVLDWDSPPPKPGAEGLYVRNPPNPYQARPRPTKPGPGASKKTLHRYATADKAARKSERRAATWHLGSASPNTALCGLDLCAEAIALPELPTGGTICNPCEIARRAAEYRRQKVVADALGITVATVRREEQPYA